MNQETETEKQHIEMVEKPELEVNIFFNARTAPEQPCKIKQLGFDLKAISRDYVRVDLRGAKDFPDGAWITSDELQQFIDGLANILEKFEELPLFNADSVDVVWRGD